MQTIGEALCRVYTQCGLYIFANQDYMSRIRGGNNFFQLRIAPTPLFTLRARADIIVALDKPSIALHRQSVQESGVMVLDTKKFDVIDKDNLFFDVPMYEMAVATGGSELYINSVSLGVVAAMTNMECNRVERIVQEIFSDKTEEVIAKNTQCARQGYDFVKKNFTRNDFFLSPVVHSQATLRMGGNEAIALGALRAGCKFYCAYPMTPSTGIMNTLAHYAQDFNLVVEQAEDEIAAITMALGASFTGARAMTGTSGGGFALMAEGISLAAMTETPVVVAEVQRPGPATGFPTRTEQADLDFVLHAGHGEFAKVVFTPGSIEQAFYLTVKAFNLAEKYQIPVIIISDQHLADSMRNIEAFDMKQAQVYRSIISHEDSKDIRNYTRYALNASGISPRAIPSWIDEVIYVDSDEHTQEGHITEDAQIRKAMVEKRLYKKMAGLMQEIEKPYAGNAQGAKIMLVGFGSTYGVMKEACEEIKKKKVGFLHFPQVWPFPAEEALRLLKGVEKIITVENNAGGQFAGLLRRETGIKADVSILKYDGRPFDLDYLLMQIESVI